MVKSEVDVAEERRKITVEIFELTGQKIGLDDPVSTAALFYSTKMRQATEAVNRAAEKVNRSTKTIHRGIEEAMKNKLQSAAAANSHPPTEDKKTIIRAASAMSLVAVLGVFVGETCFQAPDPLTPAQRKALSVGQEFLQILPSLDKTTRSKLMQALANRSHTK